MLWTHLFLENPFYRKSRLYLKNNVLFQDSKSAILIEMNSHNSAGKISWHLNIWFFCEDQKGHINIKFCPTDQLVADYMTLHGLCKGKCLSYFDNG